MTLINLPRTNQTGPNEWEDVEANDRAIANVVNGQLTDENIRDGADISGLKLADGTIPTAKLTDQAVTTAKLMNQAVTSEKLKFATGAAYNSVPFTGGDDLVVSMSLSPGIYLVQGVARFSTGFADGVVDVWLAHSGGAATRQPSEDVAPAALPFLFVSAFVTHVVSVSAIYTVTETTSLHLYALRRSGDAGTVSAGLTVFGFAAT